MEQITARKLHQRPNSRVGIISSPRGTRKPMLSALAQKGYYNSNSQSNLNIPKSPLTNRKNPNYAENSNGGSSAQNSPNIIRRPAIKRSSSVDRINNYECSDPHDRNNEEAVALLSNAATNQEQNTLESDSTILDLEEISGRKTEQNYAIV